MDFAQWVQETLGLDVAALTDQQKALIKARFDKEQATIKAGAGTGSQDPPPVKAKAFSVAEIQAAYDKHAALIAAKAEAHKEKVDGDKLAAIRAKAAETSAIAKAKAIEEEWQALRFEVELVKAAAQMEVEMIRAERPTGPAIHSGSRDLSAPVIEAALARSAGLRAMDKAYKPEVLEAADRQYRNFGVQELLLVAARAAGYEGRQRIGSDNLREVLEYACPIRAAGVSTIAVSGILSNVANKMLLDGFNTVPQSWRAIAGTRPVKDFKTVTAYRLTASLEYEEVGPTGEIEHGELGQESYTMAAKTYAKMLALTRQDIINDDLGAFNDLRTRLGMGATLKLNKVFWTLWINNSSFFTSGRLNIQTSAALADATLASAVTLFRQMTGPDGNLLGLEPALLLVPPELEATARKFYVSAELRDTTASTKLAVANIYQNRFQPVVVPELSNSAYTGYSATSWYLLANPAVMATAVVCFLNGVEAPTVESADADFNTLGIQFRGFHDFGAAMTEYRAGVKSTA